MSDNGLTIPEAAKPSIETPNKRAGWLLAGLATLTGVFTAVGVGTSELPHVWRNHAGLSHLAVTLVLVAIALGATAGWILKKDSHWERKLLLIGNALLGLGLVLAAWAAMATATDRPAPSVTAVAMRTKSGTVLKVTASDNNLTAKEHLSLMVEPLFEVGAADESVQYRIGRPLYSASLGPDRDGEINRSASVEIPPGHFEDVGVRASVDPTTPCYETHTTTGCAVVRVRQDPERPQLSFAWRKGRRGAHRLIVHLRALDMPFTSMRLLARSLRPKRRLLAHLRLAPDLHGGFDRTLALPVGRARSVCVSASTTRAPLRCPPRKRSDPSWAKLTVPPGS